MDGKTALVTGSTQGIGLGIAQRLASVGCSVILTGLAEPDTVDKNYWMSLEVAHFRTYKGNYHFVPGDLRYPAAIRDMCKKITEIYPNGIDILINNAGTQHVAPVEDYPIDKWDELVAVNMTAPFLLIKYFLPFMKTKGRGRIVSTSSQMGMISAPGKASYSATKAGLIGLTKGVALETAEHGVTCNAICPGYVDTHLADPQIESEAQKHGLSFQEAKTKWVNFNNPTHRPVTVSQVAGLVAFLCSEEAANITGTTLPIDAGNTAR